MEALTVKAKRMEIAAHGPELDILKGKIIEYDAGCRQAFGEQMGYAFLAGLALNRAKDLVPHGNSGGPGFTKWREANLPEISERSARRYMEFSGKLILSYPAVGKTATVAVFKSERLELPEGALPEQEQKAVLQAVHDAADGKTLTEMYRDLGIIREAKKQQHHPRKPTTPEQELEAARTAAAETVLHLATSLRALHAEGDPTLINVPDKWTVGDSHNLSHLNPRRELLDWCVATAKVLRKMMKKKGRKS